MPRKAQGSVTHTRNGWTCRVTLKGRERRSYELPACRTQAEAEERAQLLADLARRFRKADLIQSEQALKLLDMAASAAPALLPGVLKVADELTGGVLVAEQSAPTFGEVSKLWTSGELHSRFPDHVKAKDGAKLDRQRLSKIEAVDVGGIAFGDIPITDVTLDHAQAVMSQLPERARRLRTRKTYAQLISRVLTLAAWPLRIIERNPLPKGFSPAGGKSPAYAYLYPAEDTQLMACEAVPFLERLFFGFLVREGCRASEAAGLTWSDVDLDTGTVSLDENKTSDPRTWALDASVTRALKAWHAKSKPSSSRELIFRDEHAPFNMLKLAERFREALLQAGVDRPEIHRIGTNRLPMRAHDLRGTFVTLALAIGKSEAWVADRTGHRSSDMINKYRRKARGAQELGLGWLAPLDQAIPELELPTVENPAIAQQINKTAGKTLDIRGFRKRFPKYCSPTSTSSSFPVKR